MFEESEVAKGRVGFGNRVETPDYRVFAVVNAITALLAQIQGHLEAHSFGKGLLADYSATVRGPIT